MIMSLEKSSTNRIENLPNKRLYFSFYTIRIDKHETQISWYLCHGLENMFVKLDRIMSNAYTECKTTIKS